LKWLIQKFELSRGGGTNERPMEGLRGFAVFLVYLVHFVTLIDPWLKNSSSFLLFTKAIHTIGNTGVDLFFVLSGYLIYGSLISRNQNFFRFLSRRVHRIYPAFTAVFALYVFLSFEFPHESKIPLLRLEGLIYLIQNFLLLPGLLPIEPMITVAWSLSYEMFYYLVIPIAILIFRLRIRSSIWRLIFFMIIALLATIYCALYNGPVRLIMFISGITLYEIIKINYFACPSSSIGFIFLLVGLMGTLIPIYGPAGFALKTSILFVSFFILCLVCFRNSTSWLPTAFSWTPLRWLGNMSYSYYLLHGLVLKAGFLALPILVKNSSDGTWLFWILLPFMFFLTLIPTAVLFLLVERPFSLLSSSMKVDRTGKSVEESSGNALHNS